MKSNKIYALIGKPLGKGINKYWRAFSFSSNAYQSDIEAFMCYIHVDTHEYFLTMATDLEAVHPKKGSSNAVTTYYHDSLKYGKIFVNDTPVGFSWEYRKENGREVKRRLFKVR